MTTRRRIIEDAPQDEQEGHDEALPIKYRPKHLDDVVGQPAVVKSLRDSFKSKTRAHAYCFTGPSGTGKTTLARIAAAALGCSAGNIVEVDAASNSGIDAMKELTSSLRYQGFGEMPNKAFIIDEAHSLSKQAWQALLKPMEEPPPHVFFFLCTTEAGKIPETIVTRCQSYVLKAVKFDDIMDLLETVADREGFTTNDKIIQMVGRACGGSPRNALTMLGAVNGCQDEDEAQRILETPLENAEVIELCRKLLDDRLTWEDVTTTLKGLDGMAAESIRIVICNYLAACMMKSKGKGVVKFLNIYSCFAKPFPVSDKLGPLLLAFGDLLYSS